MRTGAKIFHAKNGKQAVEICHSQNIDLVLKDIRIPLKNGCQATREILKDKPQTLVIAQTAYTPAHDREEALAADCKEFISKPVKRQQLIGIIEKLWENQ